MGAYAPAALVNPPVIQPLRFGLFNVATVIDYAEDNHELNGITYKSLACSAELNDYVAVCPPSGNPDKTSTDDGRATIIADDLIELYVNLSCKETTLEAMFAEARAIFALGESRAFEVRFWDTILAQPTTTILNTVAGTAGALSVTAAIAALESYMGCNYPGRPVFHADRGVATYTQSGGNHLIRTPSGLETLLGSDWASYACAPNTGPDGTPAPDGHTWIYVTSQPVIRRWPVKTLPGSVDYVLKIGTNEPQVIVERTYLPSVDCAKAAVLVCLGACE